jgi:hypothetical protein
MYLVAIVYKDREIKPSSFKEVSKMYKEPKENALILVGKDNESVVSIPYDNILYYHAAKDDGIKEEPVLPLQTKKSEDVINA